MSPSLSIFYGANNLIKQSFLTQAAGDIQATPCPGNALPATSASLSTASPLDCKPSSGFRKAAVANDLRNWLPTRPMLMCGGANDPTVNFVSTRATSGYFRAKRRAGLRAGGGGPGRFGRDRRFLDGPRRLRAGQGPPPAQNTPGSASDQAQAVTLAYHGTLVPPFCMVSARGFFQGVLAAGG